MLIKEIGTDALFALRLLASYMDKNMGTSYLERVQKFHDHCREGDLAVAVAQTDVKGDRGKGPADQAHPDYYVRVAAQDDEGITLRGAKVHTSVSTNAHEIIVLPTRNMRAGDEAYAVACAVPANAPGLTMLASGYGGRKGTEFENPISSKHKMMETLTVFDDVKVPWERVFLNGEVEMAGPLAKTFVEFHRFTAVSYKLPLVDLFVGASHLMAEYNGILRAGHVRDKLAKLISYAQICRGMTREAARECKVIDGVAVPNAEIINIAKLHFATGYHQALAWVQDIAGGLLVTGPSAEDLDDPKLGELIDKYLGASPAAPTLDRLKAHEPHCGDHGVRLRGLSGRARDSRGRQHRSGEDDHLARARNRPSHRLRETPRGHRIKGENGMDPTQALVAIWLNVAPENCEEFRKWHNCEHSTDRMDGPGFRAGYRYNAIDPENANHNVLCTFEGIPSRRLRVITTKNRGTIPRPGRASAWPSSKTRSARSTACKLRSVNRTATTPPISTW